MAIPYFKINRPIKLLLGIAVVFIAFLLLRKQLQDITLAMVIQAIHVTPIKYVLCSMLATFISFAAMGGNELIAAQTLNHRPLPWSIPILAGMAGNAFANTLGFPGFTISAWRYRVYAAAGLTIKDITRVTAVAFMGIILGYLGTVTLCTLFSADSASTIFTAAAVRFYLGIAGLLLIVFFLIWASMKRRKIGWGQWSFSLPGEKRIGLQLILGMIDLSAAIFAAYILLPAHVAPFAEFAIFYVGALLFGIASQAPGGIGVFEAGIITALALQGRADVVAALLLFRLIYNIIPFCLACVVLAYKTQTVRRSR